MTLLHSDPPSRVSTGTLTLTARITPRKQSTPTATLSAVTSKLQSPSMEKARKMEQELHEHELEELDVEAELRADGENPFPIDRRMVKEVVQDKMGVRIDRVAFLSSGTFHKAFLLHLAPGQGPHIPQTVVFRIARRTMHMPRLKTDSEVATLAYLRTRTSVPVPTVYWYDANPYNALGGEWMVMSKAPGVPLSRFFHTLPTETLRKLLANLAELLIPLFEHRFPAIGSLYFTGARSTTRSAAPPGAVPLATHASTSSSQTEIAPGPIVSYPFFGSSRGLLSHTSKPAEIDRGPWGSFSAYLAACSQREIDGVVREGQGREVGHRPRVAPMSEEGSGSSDEDDWGVDWNGAGKSRTSSFGPSSLPAAFAGVGVGGASFGPSTFAFVSDDDDASSESDSDSSGAHESYYRDYRATQRSTFLVAHTARREASVREEMGVFLEVMTALKEEAEGGLGLGEFGERGKLRRRSDEDDAAGEDAFTLDPHDLSLENVFVDEHDHSKITCIIDWESTCTRPLFQAAHLPSFLQPHHGHGHHHGHHRPHGHGHHGHSHAHTPHRPHLSRAQSYAVHTPLPRYVASRSPAAQMFREEVARLGRAGAQWLRLEGAGEKRRWAHRVVEWDGWEEGLAGEILGELEYGWEVEMEGIGVGAGAGAGRSKARVAKAGGGERDVSADGGRELGRRLEQWVKDGATVALYHDHEEAG